MKAAEIRYNDSKCQQLIKEMHELSYPHIGKAEDLRGRIKELAAEYLPSYFLYNSELEKIRFTKRTWNNDKQQMLLIVYSIQNFIQKENKESGENKKSNTNFWLLLITTVSVSALLWSFNNIVHWQWLEMHSKKIPMYLCAQLIILLGAYRIYSKTSFKFFDVSIPVFLAFLSLM